MLQVANGPVARLLHSIQLFQCLSTSWLTWLVLLIVLVCRRQVVPFADIVANKMASRTVLCMMVIFMCALQAHAGYNRWWGGGGPGQCTTTPCSQYCKSTVDKNLARALTCTRQLYWECAENWCMCSACYAGCPTWMPSKYKC